MPELKPCSFCGGNAELFVDEGVRVLCRRCGVSTGPMTDSLAFDGPTNAIRIVVEIWSAQVEIVSVAKDGTELGMLRNIRGLDVDIGCKSIVEM